MSNKALTLVAKLNKKFKKIIIGKASEMDLTQRKVSTGSVFLDYCIGGGFPLGRIVELYGTYGAGKTLISLMTIAEAQQQDIPCYIIDAEKSFDVEHAQNLGVDTDKLIITQIAEGETIFDILIQIAELGEESVIFVDSVSSLVPIYEATEGMDKQTMALQARIMSKGLRKLNNANSKSLIIFSNQIREKVGVTYGCIHGETLVNFVGGRSLLIETIVENKIDDNVYCYDEVEKKIVTSEIIGWHNNGKIENEKDFIHLQTESIKGGGRFGLTVTPEHEIFCNSRWTKAKNVEIGDKLLSKYKQLVNGTYKDFIYGCLIGDAHLAQNKNTSSFRIQDNENKEYMLWKKEKIEKIEKIEPFEYFAHNRKLSRYSTKYRQEFTNLKKVVDRRDPMFMLNRYSDLSMAIWIMDESYYDNGSFHNRYILSVYRFRKDKKKLFEISKKLEELGFNNSIGSDARIVFTSEATDRIMKRIYKYVPTCMGYKLAEKYKNKYEEFQLSNTLRYVEQEVMVVEKRYASKRQMRNKNKYDLTIKDYSNYMIGGINNGVIVHNSNETTSGGRALGHYASIRVEIRRGKFLMDDEKNRVGQIIKFKIDKNKVARPQLTGYFRYIYSPPTIDIYEEIIALSKITKVLKTRGAWLDVLGEQFHGSAALEERLRTDDKFFEELKHEVLHGTGPRGEDVRAEDNNDESSEVVENKQSP